LDWNILQLKWPTDILIFSGISTHLADFIDNSQVLVHYFLKSAFHCSKFLIIGCHKRRNLTSNKFIRHVRLNKAKFLLQYAYTNITVVAYATGFNDSAYFSRLFKKEFGIAPQEWKKEQSTDLTWYGFEKKFYFGLLVL
jgi:two-component system response regulator YesN